ncbi:Card1-like endonuclease domain-containing protein [Maridesulfovibrio sp.]|uniref:Card1-like endonuclease domain-containing protein n=1 Tax=unclassified Maridesulfovibrio TaxID=2794999 RepID=UPI003B00DA14
MMHYIAICSHDLVCLIPPFYLDDFNITKCTLLLHEDNRQYAVWFKQFVDNTDSQYSEMVLSEYKYDKSIKNLQKIFEQIDDEEHVLLNTYGAQPMLLDAISECTASKENVQLCYIDIEDNKVVFLGSKDNENLPSCLSISDFLTCQGYSIVARKDPSDDKEFSYNSACVQIVNNFEGIYKGIPKINYLASSAQGSLTSSYSSPDTSGSHLGVLLSILQGANLISCTNGKISFANEEARFFANGGWLEQYVQLTLDRLYREGMISDYAVNLEIVSSIGVRNEIDAAFTAKNKFFVIECKTIRWQSNSDRSMPVYKLKSIMTDIGGLNARGVLVSAFDVDQKRCEEYEMMSIQHAKIINLEDNLRQLVAKIK